MPRRPFRSFAGMLRWSAVAVALGLACAPARAADQVSVGLANTLNDATLYVAADRGYFREEGLEVNFVVLDSGGKMIAPLGAGQLDVGSGALSAGLYNAIERGVGIRIVADRGRTAPGFDYQTIVIRKGLVDKVHGVADLKGLKFGFAAPGVSSLSVLNQAAKAGGVSFDDIEKIYIAFPQQVVAFKNSAIDASMFIEPYATIVVNAGDGVRLMSTESFYPNDVIGTLFFGEQMAQQRPDVGRRFIKAYLRAVRDYVAATTTGKIKDPAIIDIIVNNFKVERSIAEQMYSQAIQVNGLVTPDELRKDWQFFKDQGLIKGTVPLEKIVDMQFVDAALKDLGRK
jgi:NitT/TauT family transport system substrate-binding protein